MTPDRFIVQISPAARAVALSGKIPASFTIAQAALESSWGESRLAQLAHNLFGVKAGPAWHGPTITMQTREFSSGKWVYVPALWRWYKTWSDCMSDHADFLHDNKRYHAAFSPGLSGEEFALAVAAAGYATDPQYAGKLVSVIRAHNLAALDLPSG